MTAHLRAALIVVDLQPDFMPGGALPVAGGDRVVEPIARLVRSGGFGLVVATQDWHPPGHASFASAHPGKQPFDVIMLHGHEQVLWPDHCVQGTAGAALHQGLPLDRVDAIIRKGTDPGVDSYSGLRNNWDARGERPPTGLAGYLRERGMTDVTVCGLARDYCVKWTAEDAADAGFRVRFLWELTRSVDPAGDDRVRADLVTHAVSIA
jgi:nicotinamidase/pyrazinamidase